MANRNPGEQKVYLQGEVLLDQASGKQGVSMLDQLYDLARVKNSKVFEFFKKNAMNMNHYMEFRKTCVTFDFADAIRTKSYVVVFSANNQGSYFIIGTDDTTGKLFCHHLPSGLHQWLDTDKKVRDAMGFDTECLEPYRIIRVQGDLTMHIVDQNDKPEELFEDRAYGELEDEVGDAIERMNNNAGHLRLEEIIETSENFFMLDNDLKFVKGLLVSHGMMAERDELERLEGTEYASAYMRKVAHILMARIAYQKEFDFLKKNKQRIVQRAYDSISRREERYTMMQGEHKITLTATAEIGRDLRVRDMIRQEAGSQITQRDRAGIRMRTDRRRVIFYILRPSTITIEHKEHGKRELMIMKPSAIRFGILNRFGEARPENGRMEPELGELRIARNQLGAAVSDFSGRIDSLRERDLR